MKIIETLTEVVQLVLSIPFRFALIFFTGFKVKGRSNLRHLAKGKGVIFASNHDSQLDSVAVVCSLPLFARLAAVYFVSNEPQHYTRFPVGKYFYGGRLFKLLGAYSIKKGLRDYASSLATHIKLLADKRTVFIYPEGRIVYGKELGEAHGGVAYLAKVSGAPIVPMAIVGSDDMSVLDFFLFRRKLKIIFGVPVMFDEIDEPSLPEETRYREAATRVMNRVKNMIDKERGVKD